MITIIGANSHLVPAILSQNPNEKYLLLSRDKPEIKMDLKYDASWVQTDYSNHKEVISSMKSLASDKIVWLSAPFVRDFLINHDSELIDSVLKKGITFPIEVARGIIPSMITKQFGRFLFIGSSLAELGDKGSVLYSVVKSAQAELSRGIAIEYGRFNITSNVLSLGPLVGGLAGELQIERKAEYLSRTSRGYLITEEEVAFNVHSILQSKGISGQKIYLDGGFR